MSWKSSPPRDAPLLSMHTLKPEMACSTTVFAEFSRKERHTVCFRNCHFTSCDLAPAPDDFGSIVMGSAKGDVCTVETAAIAQGRQSLSSVVSSCVSAHHRGTNSVRTIQGMFADLHAHVLYSDSFLSPGEVGWLCRGCSVPYYHPHSGTTSFWVRTFRF